MLNFSLRADVSVFMLVVANPTGLVTAGGMKVGRGCVKRMVWSTVPRSV